MSAFLHSKISNLKPFDYAHHHDTHLINQTWVLVNGISNKKSIYTFKANNILEIQHKDKSFTTSWSIKIHNQFSITTEDGIIDVKAYFKDDDILVLHRQDKEEFALYINTACYDDDLNSVEDIQDFLKEKYKKKLSHTIHKHQFYYISESEEFGPCTVEALKQKVQQKRISPHCFVRDINEDNYAKRLRIIDLITVT